jgi:hypothetical protein
VEDRISAGLWIELAQSEVGDYGSRAQLLMSHQGISSAWWGSNQKPNRTDLPRVLDEFSVLGVYEVGPEFAPPDVPAWVSGMHFMRTPRPGQGILTGAETTGILLVLISPKRPEAANSLRDWGDFVHIRHIVEAAVPGYSMITPYESADTSDPRYMHLYEMDTTDPEATFKSMTPRVSSMLGEPGTPNYDDWAWNKDLRIFYVNSFKRAGSIVSTEASRVPRGT